ncbi:MAG TPA: hypothetical protein VIG88_13565 [Lysobacter sp.]
MSDTPSASVADTPPAARRPRLPLRLLFACIAAFTLPLLLVFAALQGAGSRAGPWALAILPLPLLCTWAFAARRRPAGPGRSMAVLAGIVGAVLLCFATGAIVVTLATLLWQPQVDVVLPQSGA